MNGSASKVCNLLARAHHARMEVRRLEEALAKSPECQFIEGNMLALHIELCEMDADAVPDARNISGEIDDPCWKRHLHYSPMSDTQQWVAVGDARSPGWCDACRKREALWLQGKAARRTLGGLKSAIWRAAKKCAEVSGLTAIRDAMSEGE